MDNACFDENAGQLPQVDHNIEMFSIIPDVVITAHPVLIFQSDPDQGVPCLVGGFWVYVIHVKV